jgi:hypothetical protein
LATLSRDFSKKFPKKQQLTNTRIMYVFALTYSKSHSPGRAAFADAILEPGLKAGSVLGHRVVVPSQFVLETSLAAWWMNPAQIQASELSFASIK